MAIQLWNAPMADTKFPHGLAVDAFNFVIKAGAPSTIADVQGTVIAAGATPKDSTEVTAGMLWSVSMHMHLLGSSTNIDLVHADGSRRCLLRIPAWSDGWQGSYDFANPIAVKAGDQIAYRCDWDNSAAHQPVVDGHVKIPVDVHWGFDVLSEMCSGGATLTDP